MIGDAPIPVARDCDDGDWSWPGTAPRQVAGDGPEARFDAKIPKGWLDAIVEGGIVRVRRGTAGGPAFASRGVWRIGAVERSPHRLASALAERPGDVR